MNIQFYPLILFWAQLTFCAEYIVSEPFLTEMVAEVDFQRQNFGSSLAELLLRKPPNVNLNLTTIAAISVWISIGAEIPGNLWPD